MYKEITLTVPVKLDKPKSAEKAVKQFFTAFVDCLHPSQKVPFWKPIYAYCKTVEQPEWDGLLQFIDKENADFKKAINKEQLCIEHNQKYEHRVHNHTETYGCLHYLSGKCKSGFTFYLPSCVLILEGMSSGLSPESLNGLLHFVKTTGASGCPDFLALKENVLWFVEVKTKHERISELQEKYLEWCSSHGGQGILLRVVEGRDILLSC